MATMAKIQSARATPVGLRPARRSRAVPARAAVAGPVPDQNKRNIVNLMLVGATALPTAILAGPFLAFFFPPSASTPGGGLPAKDEAGNTIKASQYLAKYPKGTVKLCQGLGGDPTYLIVKEDEAELRDIGLNAVCTHLGCVVPWNSAEKKFKCPCHGSQYNRDGKVIRGPAPLSLPLQHVAVDDDIVTLVPWSKDEKDFRTDTDPWWV